MLQADEIRAILDAAGQPMQAMILLAVNMGFGNNDVARLSRKVIDLSAGWIRRPGPKTGIVRCAPIWPETVVWLKAAMAAGRGTEGRGREEPRVRQEVRRLLGKT